MLATWFFAVPALMKSSGTDLSTFKKAFEAVPADPAVEKFADKTGMERFISVARERITVVPPTSWPDPEGARD